MKMPHFGKLIQWSKNITIVLAVLTVIRFLLVVVGSTYLFEDFISGLVLALGELFGNGLSVLTAIFAVCTFLLMGMNRLQYEIKDSQKPKE